MKMLHDLGPIDRFPYLAGIGLNPEDLGRVEVAAGVVSDPGLYVDATTGESRLLVEGDRVPDGVWVAQEVIDELKSDGGADIGGEHGAGQGWGRQGVQLGGDRSSPEADSGGTAGRTPDQEGSGDDSPAAP